MGRKKKEIEAPEPLTREIVSAFVLEKAGRICGAGEPLKEEELVKDRMDSLDTVEVIMACEVEYQKCVPENESMKWGYGNPEYRVGDFINDIWGVVGRGEG